MPVINVLVQLSSEVHSRSAYLGDQHFAVPEFDDIKHERCTTRTESTAGILPR